MTKIRKKTKNSRLKREMAGKLLGYSAMAGAALVAGVPTAEAVPTVLTGPSTDEFLDLDGNGSDDVKIHLQTGATFGIAKAYGQAGGKIGKYNTLAPQNALLFQNTSSITGGAPKYGNQGNLANSNTGGTNGGKFLGQRGFLGVRFDSPLNGSGFDFGFVDLEANLDATTVTIHNFGMVGAATVPEPGTLSMLAIGLGGLYAMRRRSEKQKAALNNQS